MDFLKLARERYSCKKYDGSPITKEQLNVILEAGRLAPTAKNLQEYHIYVLESQKYLEKIDKVTMCRYGAPTVLVVVYDKNNAFVYPGGKYNTGAEDATIVATHMMLAAQSVGVDSCWVNLFDPDMAAKELNLPENEVVVMMLDLGHRAEGVEPLPNHNKRKSLEEAVTYL